MESAKRHLWLAYRIADRFYYIPLILVAFGTLYLNFFYNGMSGMLGNYRMYEMIIRSGFDSCMIRDFGKPTFPMWGYGWLMLVDKSKIALLIMQNAIAIACTMYFIDGMDKLRKNAIGSGTRFCIKYAMVFAISWHCFHSTQWPQSVATSLYLAAMMMLVRAFDTPGFHPWFIVGSGVLFGLGLNFRSDYLLFAVCASVLIVMMEGMRLEVLRKLGAWVSTIFLLMAPWMAYSKMATGHVLLSSTNGGAALLGGLGNLPGNKWGLAMSDDCIWKIVQDELGPCSQMYSYETDRYLKQRFMRLIAEDPKEYLRKVWYVFRRQACRECEAANFGYSPNFRDNVFFEIRYPEDYLSDPIGVFRRHGMNALVAFGQHFAWQYNRIVLPKSFLLLLVTLPLALYRKNFFVLLVCANIIYQLALQCLIGHMAVRTMNSYAFLVVNMILGIGYLVQGAVFTWNWSWARLEQTGWSPLWRTRLPKAAVCLVIAYLAYSFHDLSASAAERLNVDNRLDHYRRLALNGGYRKRLSLQQNYATNVDLSNSSPWKVHLLRIPTRGAEIFYVPFQIRVEGCLVQVVANSGQKPSHDTEGFGETCRDELHDSAPGQLLFELHGEEYVDLDLVVFKSTNSTKGTIRICACDIFILDPNDSRRQ